MDGYFRSEELTKETVVDGVLYTSDLGYIDEAGRVYVIGRKDDIINYKGIKIAPEEIENVAVRYKGIKDCACIPIEDPVCGQAPKLFVSLYPLESVNMQQFMDYLKQIWSPTESRYPLKLWNRFQELEWKITTKEIKRI